ncbi:MAG: hypothetical protein ACLGHN_12625 [Bacteriovoracia bacterium]
MKALISTILLLGLVSCQTNEGKSSGGESYPVSLSMGSYTTARVMNFFISEAYANVSDLRVCFKRLRFKTTLDDTIPGDNIDFPLGEVTLSTSGTLLGSVVVPAGTYYRVEFDLEPECAGKSLNLSNDFGVYSAAETIKIKFDGVFVVDGSTNLELGVQDILNAANAYNGVGTLKETFENVSGNL